MCDNPPKIDFTKPMVKGIRPRNKKKKNVKRKLRQKKKNKAKRKLTTKHGPLVGAEEEEEEESSEDNSPKIGNQYMFSVECKDKTRRRWPILLDFVIENHSDGSDFAIEIYSGKKKIREENIKIQKGSEMKKNFEMDDLGEKRIIIKVIQGEDIKEIYKNL